MSRTSARGFALTCPHCGERALIRSSRLVTETYREGWAICAHCGFSGKAHVAWDAEANPSLAPNPQVQLPRMQAAALAADSLQTASSSPVASGG